jgi:hypothetical protein
MLPSIAIFITLLLMSVLLVCSLLLRHDGSCKHAAIRLESS